MLDMRPDCERCGTDLPPQAHGAFICSFECTFCADCADELDDPAFVGRRRPRSTPRAATALRGG